MRAVLFVFICCALTALAWTKETNESKPSATVSPAWLFENVTGNATATPTAKMNTTTLTPTAAKKITTTTTPTPTTPKKNTTTTPTTTTPKKNTTTTPTPTTPKKNTTTTTTPTTTTTTPIPSTMPPVTPATKLEVGKYTLNYPNKTEVCVMAVMALQIRLQSTEANGTFIVQANETSTEGNCKESTANLTIAFKEGFITFLFNKSVANNTAYVDGLTIKLSYPFGKGVNGVYRANNMSVYMFAAKIGHCYSCKSESLYMGNGLYLDVTQDRMQAFNLTKNNDFGYPDHCASDRSGYGAAIAVGITLLVLIVIVVIVYLLGRRRRTDGYQSL